MAESPLPASYTVTTDPARLDLDFVHNYLSTQSYWAQGVARELVERAVAGSLCFCVLAPDGRQVGFARVVTDRASFAWLADVFIDPAAQGGGLGKALVSAVVGHPDLSGLRRFMLATADAHGLYTQFGFEPLARPERLMERLDAETRARLAPGR